MESKIESISENSNRTITFMGIWKSYILSPEIVLEKLKRIGVSYIWVLDLFSTLRIDKKIANKGLQLQPYHPIQSLHATN